MGSPLEILYPLVPVWAQNLGISLYGVGWRRERLGGRFEEYVDAFREREKWQEEQFQNHLDTQLRKVVQGAFLEVPYYAKAWRSAGITAKILADLTVVSLERLPITPKAALRAQPGEFVSRAFAGQRLHRYHSSGTTGTPITAICTSDGHRRFTAAREARSFGWAGTSLRKPRSMIGGRMILPKGCSGPPFHRYNWAEKQVYFSAYHISPENASHYISALNRHRPRVFTGYAYSHYLLAKMMLAQGLVLDYEPDALVLSSEKLTPEMKSVLRSAFRARPYEEYGCVENCVLATECEHGRLHVSPDFGILEIVDFHGRPVPPGVEGRILCTSLLNEAQPLIRYEIGDLGIWSAENCPCGRKHLPVLEQIVGRLEDLVKGPDGRQMVRFHGIFVNLAPVIEGQVIQEALGRFTVKLVVTSEFGDREEQTIRKRFEERLGKVQVTIQKVREIPRTERGKFRAVVSHLKSDSEQQKAT
jgi:phenylacetate-CoA ligase